MFYNHAHPNTNVSVIEGVSNELDCKIWMPPALTAKMVEIGPKATRHSVYSPKRSPPEIESNLTTGDLETAGGVMVIIRCGRSKHRQKKKRRRLLSESSGRRQESAISALSTIKREPSRIPPVFSRYLLLAL